MKDYFGIKSLRGLIRMTWLELDKKVGFSNVINNLTTTSDDTPLSATQGKVLNDKIKAMDSNGDGTVNNSDRLGGQLPEYYAKATDFDAGIMELSGQPNGLCPLDAAGQVSSEFLPSYVDDVIECYINLDTNKAYLDAAKKQQILTERGKIYVNIDPTADHEGSYRWSGTKFVEITSSDMLELEEQQVIDMWYQVANEVHNTIKDFKFIASGTASKVSGTAITDRSDTRVVVEFLGDTDNILKTIFITINPNGSTTFDTTAGLTAEQTGAVKKVMGYVRKDEGLTNISGLISATIVR